MLLRLMSCLAPAIFSLRDRIRRWTRPSTRPILGYMMDRFRSPADLARENALLRKQLEVACRQIARPRFTRADRGMPRRFSGSGAARLNRLASWLWATPSRATPHRRPPATKPDPRPALVDSRATPRRHSYRWCNPPTRGRATTSASASGHGATDREVGVVVANGSRGATVRRTVRRAVL